MRRAHCSLFGTLVAIGVAAGESVVLAQPSPTHDAPGTNAVPPPSGSATPSANPPTTGTASAGDSAPAPAPPAAPAPTTPEKAPAPTSSAKADAKSAEVTRERRPSPIEVDYAQYGIGLGGDINLTSGRICPPGAFTPCILGSGGGLAIRGGYRPSGPWYFGGAYQFSKLDSNNQYRLAIFQQLRGEMRYFLDFGSRVTPYVLWGVGGVWYGNEWGASTGGAMIQGGGGMEFEITRFALVGLDLAYAPVLLAGYTDTTGQKRETGISQFLRLELTVELRTELGRE